MNCCVVPGGIDGFAGVTAIDTRTAGPTVKLVPPVTPPEEALIVVAPCLRAVARPPEVIVATVASDEVQEAELVTSRVDPSE